MKRLKCPDCGGQVRLQTSYDGHVLGKCGHCAAEFVIEAKGRQHIIVEHRFPDSISPVLSRKPPAQLARRAVLGFGGVALLATAAAAVGFRRKADSGSSDPEAEVLFNVGGEGPGAGQFRDQVYSIGIDSLGRAALVDNRDRIYIYGPEGQFISHYTQDESRKGRFCGLRPRGDLIFAQSNAFHRLALESGSLIETVETASDTRGWNAAHSLTAEGGIAVYSTEEHGHNQPSNTPVKDHITVFAPELKEQRRLTGLLSQAIAPDPMVSQWPEVTSVAFDPAGSFYLNIRAVEDNDLRGGIFEFSADGRLQRRIEVDQSWHGHLAIGQDNAIWYGDPWRNDLQRISMSGRRHLALSGLADKPSEALGNIASFALYPNGDIGVTTMNHRFARLRPLLAAG